MSFSQDYVFFYGNGCTHCAKVENFFKQESIEKSFSLEKKEIYFNRDNLSEFNSYIDKLGLPSDQVGVPMLIIDSESESCSYLAGDKSIIDFFQKKLDELVT
jgi:glutaredoxin